MKLSSFKLNDDNPRIIRDVKFKQLVASIRDFPKMMSLRPMVANNKTDRVIIGGNMRMRACIALGMDDVPDDWFRFADDMTEDEIKRFLVVDNVSFGEWDWDALANTFDNAVLMDWGVDIPQMGTYDVTVVETTSDGINFMIRCDDLIQLEQLKKKLNTAASRIGYVDFMDRMDKPQT